MKDLMSAVLAGPVILLGPPGVGKTALISALSRQMADHLGQPVRMVRLWGPQLSALHFGAPVIDSSGSGSGESKTVSLALNRQLAEAMSSFTLLVIEDITAAPPSVLSFLLGVFDTSDPHILDHPVPKRVFRVATGNERGSAASVVLPPLIGRCAVTRYLPDVSQWPQEFLRYWGDEDRVLSEHSGIAPESWGQTWRTWRTIIAGFLTASPKYIFTEEPEPGKLFASPRAWDMLSRALAFAGEPGNAEVDSIARAYLPPEPGVAFVQYVEGLRLPPVLEIIQGGTLRGFRPDQVLIIAGMIQAWWKGKLPVQKWTREDFSLLVGGMHLLLDECYSQGRLDIASLLTEGWMPEVIGHWELVERATGVPLYGTPKAFFPPHWSEVAALYIRAKALHQRDG